MMMIHIKHKPFLIFALVRHKQDHKFQKKTFFWESNLVGADGLWEIAGRRRRDSPTAAGEGNVDKDLGGIDIDRYRGWKLALHCIEGGWRADMHFEGKK